MIRAIRYELIRLRTIRSTWWLALLSLLATGSISWAIAVNLRAGPLDVADIAVLLTGGALYSPLVPPAVLVVPPAVFMAVLGVLALGHEYRYSSIRATLTAIPRRSRVLAAKTLAVALAAAVVAVLSLAVGWGVGFAVLGEQMLDLPWTEHSLPRISGGYVAFVVLSALLGLALAGLFRNVPAALVAILVIPLVLEPVLAVVLGFEALRPVREAGKFLPFTAGRQMLVPSVSTPAGYGEPLTPVSGGLTMSAYVAALLALCWAFFARRDA
ncbi:hypothetical protein [Carbonactinospora thermoautotrophica]|uniref:hypothetical protein n=1 Tax=Carbonactinospora thermoautotrophica TaxID=1469144 RepID=UPI003DAA37C8